MSRCCGCDRSPGKQCNELLLIRLTTEEPWQAACRQSAWGINGMIFIKRTVYNMDWLRNDLKDKGIAPSLLGKKPQG